VGGITILSYAAYVLAAIGLAAAVMALRRSRLAASDAAGGMPAAVFLFRGEHLVDACPSARQRLGDLPEDGDAEPLLAESFASFPGIAGHLSALLRRGVDFDLIAPNGALRGRAQGDWRRLELFDAPGAAAARVAEQAPIPIWRQTDDGAVAWGNAAWRALARNRPASDGPLLPPGAEPGTPLRIAMPRPGLGPDLWLEIVSRPDPPGGTLNYAMDVSAEVRAEQNLRSFVDTLTTTFAHLPTGLAVFDRDRRLALFNPALCDLTRLEPAWLAGRPDFHAFLDRLRERHRMPEPKNYRSWRHELSEMEEAAARGTYRATWPLVSGETFRVTGRPHPEGALAFMFDDITGEVSLKRRFRTEIELGRAVMDRLDCAIAVFGPSGEMCFANAPFRRAIGHGGADGDPAAAEPPAAGPGQRDTYAESTGIGIVEATRIWQARTCPTPVWGELRDFAAQTQDRAEWTAEVRLISGGFLACRFAPLPQGATLCTFVEMPAGPSPV
jgi:PAS domain-containing protein